MFPQVTTDMLKNLHHRKPTERDSLIRLSFSLIITSLHSLLLGSYIFLQTEQFYQFFFGESVNNLFFVKQAGLFLFCMGLFYLTPLINLKAHHRVIYIIILTKILAVIFMLSNFSLVPRATTIFIAALGDTLFAVVLAWNSYTAGLLIRPRAMPRGHNR